MITAPTHPEITAAVLRRWQEILDDPRLNDPHQRIETDALGNIIMSPRPSGYHDQTCDWIRQVLKALPGNGAFGEHEVLTDKGVKITDVLWVNAEHPWDKHSTKPVIPAPDICVEVRTPKQQYRQPSRKTRCLPPRRLDRPLRQTIRRAFHGLLQSFSKEPKTPLQQRRLSQWPSHSQQTPDEPPTPTR